MTFLKIETINDLLSLVQSVKEIRFAKQTNNTTVGCYLFKDSNTFDLPGAVECRGITFDETGKIICRPLHKFFNIGEKPHLTKEKLQEAFDQNRIAAVYEKVDGSMISTVMLNNEFKFKTKKTFNHVLIDEVLSFCDNNIEFLEFSVEVARLGYTAIFEFVHPVHRIVIQAKSPSLQLLHVRDNVSGEYLLLDPTHNIHDLVAKYKIPLVKKYALPFNELMESLTDMIEQEGYVIQFTNGDMVKLKCPWYVRLHRSITFLRERDIALLALNEELDDVKSALKDAGIDLAEVEKIEARVKEDLLAIDSSIESAYNAYKHLGRKEFAMLHSNHPYAGLVMARYLGKEVKLTKWYTQNKWKDTYTLRILADSELMEAITDS